MTRTSRHFVVGFFIFFSLTVLFYSLMRLGLFPRQVLVWLNESENPPRALIGFSALLASGLMALVRLGVSIPGVEGKLIKTESLSPYLAGLPLWLIVGLVALSALSLFAYFPSCRPPASVLFRVGVDGQVLRPSDTLVVKPGEQLVIVAEPLQKNDVFSCRWQYAGPAFRNLGEARGCEVALEFAYQPGDGFLTLLATQNFCSQSAVFPLRVVVKGP